VLGLQTSLKEFIQKKPTCENNTTNTMKPEESIAIRCSQIYHLAWVNWRKDGCPQGMDMDYWLAAECLLESSLSVFNPESEMPTIGKTERDKIKSNGACETRGRILSRSRKRRLQATRLESCKKRKGP
jgi:hypothetical protein